MYTRQESWYYRAMGFLKLATGTIGKAGLGGAKGTGKLATGHVAGRMALGAGIGGAWGFLGSGYDSPSLRLEAAAKGALFGGAIGGATWALPRAAKGAWKLNQKAGRHAVWSAAGELGMGQFTRTNPFTGAVMTAGRRHVGTMEALKASPLGLAGKGALGASNVAAGGLMKAGTWAFEHPVMAAGIGAAGVGGVAYMNRDTPSPTMTGATMMNVNYNQQAIMADQMMTGGMRPGQYGTGHIGPAPQMMGRMHRSMMQSTYGLTQGLHRGRHG